jgi:hypothetical protein
VVETNPAFPSILRREISSMRNRFTGCCPMACHPGSESLVNQFEDRSIRGVRQRKLTSATAKSQANDPRRAHHFYRWIVNFFQLTPCPGENVFSGHENKPLCAETGKSPDSDAGVAHCGYRGNPVRSDCDSGDAGWPDIGRRKRNQTESRCSGW